MNIVLDSEQEIGKSENYELIDTKEEINKSIKNLSEREQSIISLYYDGFTLKEIGDKLSITEGRVCQLMKTIMEKLRKQLL